MAPLLNYAPLCTDFVTAIADQAIKNYVAYDQGFVMNAASGRQSCGRMCVMCEPIHGHTGHGHGCGFNATYAPYTSVI